MQHLTGLTVRYQDLIECGQLLESDQSLHLWEELYLYEGKVCQVMGAFSDPDYIEIKEENKDETN